MDNLPNIKQEPIIEKCAGIGVKLKSEGNFCNRIIPIPGGPGLLFVPGVALEDYCCSAYAIPAAKWRSCECPLASHVITQEEAAAKVRVGQQKQAKVKSKK